MITLLTEFEDSSAFERNALAVVFPLFRHPSTVAPAVVDLRPGHEGATLGVIAIDDVGGPVRDEVIHQLRPLCFGAAWKTLDLLLEFSFHAEHLVPRARRWSFQEKQQHAQRGRGQCLPLSGDTAIWERLGALYANTLEARHSLVHRRFSLAPSGDMTDIRDMSGNLASNITVAEQTAFCRTVQGAAASTLHQSFGNRDRADLAWWLDHLIMHHKFPPLGGAPHTPAPIARVIAVRVGSSWVVDIDRADEQVRANFKGRPFYDIEIYFPGTGFPPLAGHLENAPRGSSVPVDPSAPPNWINT